jgi:hypothetical protein
MIMIKVYNLGAGRQNNKWLDALLDLVADLLVFDSLS